MAGDNSGMSFWDERVLQPSLSPAEKQLRDRFVEQYIIDYDSYGACLRVGFVKSVACHYAAELMDDPYVRRQITARERTKAENPEIEKIERARMVEALLIKEATNISGEAKHSARVTALGLLAKMYKLVDQDTDGTARDEKLINAFREIATKVPV